MGLPETVENGTVRGRGREILDFIGIILQIVEFFNGLGLPEKGLRSFQLALIIELLPNPCGRCLKHVLDVLSVNPVRHVVTYVDVALVANRANQIVALIHAPAETILVAHRRRLMLPQEGMPLHVGRRLHPDQTQKSGRKIDEADQTIGLASCLVILRSQVLVFLRDVKDQGDIGPLL